MVTGAGILFVSPARIDAGLLTRSTKRLEQIEILEPPNGTSVIVIAIAILGLEMHL